MFKIDFLMPIRSQYGALHYFTKKIGEAFQRKGAACRFVEPQDFFNISAKDRPDMTFGLNGVPFDEQGRMLCDLTQIPHFSYLIDPPYRFFEILDSPWITVGCDDRYCCEFLKEGHFNRVHFLPHGVDPFLTGDVMEEKKYDIVMLSTFIDYENTRQEWMHLFPKVVTQAMDDAIDITFSDIAISFIEAFRLAYRDRLGEDPLSSMSQQELTVLLSYIEIYIKGRERAQLVTSITDSQILLFNGHSSASPGWESLLQDKFPNITLCDPVAYEEGIEFMKQAKIVLNSFSKNKQGAHDRIFNGFAAGALVLTNENLYMKESFTDEENILFFHPNQMSAVNEKISKYLSDDALRQAVAFKGREEVMARHTWDVRVDHLIDSLI